MACGLSKWTSPDLFMLLNVDLMELALDRRDDIVFHFHGHMLWEHRQQQSFLRKKKRNKRINNITFMCLI